MNEQTVNSGSHGIRWGLIIGVAYAIMIFLRYRLGSGNVITFSFMTFITFIVVLVLLFICGRKLRQQNGGWLEMREAFKAMFIAVLIFEFFFMIVTLIYLKYIDPNFFGKLRDSTENLMLAANQPQGEIDKMLSNMDQLQEQSSKVGVFDFLKTYLYYVGITGLFALFFAFILKRKPPVFHQDNFIQP
jgi:glucan phosphoethanolaminetransferase (alkaline phosphatase superfamily)